MTDQAIDERIVAKIQGLLALGADNTNEFEAAAAVAKAQEMAEKYGLELSAIGKKSDKRASVVQAAFYRTQKMAQWREWLVGTVAKTSFCRILVYSVPIGEKSNGRVINMREYRLLGKKHNIEVATYLARYLMDELERLADKWIASQARRRTQLGTPFARGQKKSQRIGWITGATIKVCERLEAAQRERMAAANNINALVVAELAEVDAYKDTLETRKGYRQRRDYDQDAASVGYRDADQLAINQAVTGGRGA